MFGFLYLFIIVNFGDSLFNFWLENKLDYDFWVMYLLICQVVIGSLLAWGGNILMATNKHEEFARWQFIINLGSLLSIYIGAKIYGLTGAVAGLLISQVIPVSCLTIYLLGNKGFPILRRETIKIILVTLFYLPFFLNFWSGILVLFGLTIYLFFKFKKENFLDLI
jgi:O-antigen/teichoic acid export membrane protein